MTALTVDDPTLPRRQKPAPDGELDCQRCGACCHGRVGTILASGPDVARWQRSGRADILSSLRPGHFSLQAFAMTPDGACTHLERGSERVRCTIYAERAESCRAVAVGSPECLAARRERRS